ncbi:MAG: hypothetical protein WC143_08505 [Eubacteriales bacterium]
MEKKLHINWRSVLGYLFILVAISLVSIASSLVYNPEEIFTARYWIVVGLKTLVSVLTFNLIYFNLMVSKKADPLSGLGKTFSDYGRFVTAVYDQKAYGKVQDEIDKGNITRFQDNATAMLQKISVALDYEKVKGSDNRVELANKTIMDFQLTKREGNRLRKTIKKVINGKVKYTKLDYNEIMLNNDTEKSRHPKMAVNEKGDLAIKNINIVLSSAIMSALFTIFALQELNTQLFYEITANAITIGFAIFNANMFSITECTKLKNAFQARKDFLCKIVDISAP